MSVSRASREKRRQERIEAEGADAGSNRNRLIVGYAIASTVVLAIAAVIFVLASGGDGDSAPEGDAHINLNASIGSTNGVEPDDRAGTVPAAAKVTEPRGGGQGGRLRAAAEAEGRGPRPHPGRLAGARLQDQPADLGQPRRTALPAGRRRLHGDAGAEIDFVHSLEHGRLEIQYAPDLPEDDQLELKGLYDTMYGATLLFPNDEHALRGRRDDLDQPARLPDLQGRGDAGRDPRLRQGDLGQVRRRAGAGFTVHRPDAGRTDLASG